MKPKSKRVVVIADTHCGHNYGLTHPDWWLPDDSEDHELKKIAKIQRLFWRWYIDVMKELQPIDVLVFNGDAIDGKGEKTGGTEQIEIDRKCQVDMARKVIYESKAKEIVIIYGSSYHVGKDEDWESVLAETVDAKKIGGHEWLDVNGLIMDFKHNINSSIIPHGRATALLRDGLWNDLWSLKNSGQPLSDVLVRSHVHYFVSSGNSERQCFITPALQFYGSKYGVRLCSGIVDVGLLSFDIINKKDWTWNLHKLDPEWAAAVPLKL